MQIEIKVSNGKRFPKKYFPDFQYTGNNTWTMYTEGKREANRIQKKARSFGLYCRVFEERYDRSADYRYRYIRANPPINGKYRCVYCGRMVRTSKMEVDHVIPVTKAKSSPRLQMKLNSKDGVNDLRNLVSSCHRCNMRKGSTYNWYWRMKAKLGQNEGLWMYRKGLRVVLALLALWYLVVLLYHLVGLKDGYLPIFTPLFEKLISFLRNFDFGHIKRI